MLSYCGFSTSFSYIRALYNSTLVIKFRFSWCEMSGFWNRRSCRYGTYPSGVKDCHPIAEFGLESSDEAHDSAVSEKQVNSIALN